MAQLHLNIEQTEKGKLYFTVYTVEGIYESSTTELHTFTSRQKAEEYRKFAKETYSNYNGLWIRERIVWID